MRDIPTVLVVDDSDIIRYSLKNFFKEYKFEVVTCMNGLEGIQKALECKPMLIILDILMPNFDGVKMLQVIKLLEDLKSIPVIVISGNTDKNNVMAALEAGADRVISKPLQKDVLIKNIKELLGCGFLLNSSKENDSVFDNMETRKHLVKFFLHSFHIKKKAIIESFDKRNKGLLNTIVHDIKGTGATIGYPELTKVSDEIEKLLLAYNIDWNIIKFKCDLIFQIVDEIENPERVSG